MPLTEQLAASLQGSLQSGDLWIALAAAFIGGLTTAFTPCVYPLIPITLRYFGGMQRVSRGRVVLRALAYVAGMVLLYATLGTVFASMKLVFGTYLASPWVLAALAVLCAAMGLSMLGAFSLQLPSGLNTRLSQVGGRGIGGAFAMGLVSGFIAAPCTGPVLAVILTLIAAAGAVSLGFTLMSAFGLGLGVPFLVLALFSGAVARVPSGGRWMEVVKVTLATAMFVVALYFAELAWPAAGRALARVPAGGWVSAGLLVLGVVAIGIYLRNLEGARGKLVEAGGVVLLTAGFGAALLGGPPAAPGAPSAAGLAVTTVGGAAVVAWETSHDAGVARARAEGRPVMIDFTAEWCQACKELDRETYVDARVGQEAARFVNLKLDATQIDERMQLLFDRYGVLGLPTVIFIDSRGEVLREPRVTGFVPAERFVELMQRVR